MKRVLFVISNLGCGGINRALENLINILNNGSIDISVLAFDTTGQYFGGFSGSRLLRPNILSNYLTRILSEQKGLAKVTTAVFKLLDRMLHGKLNKVSKQREQKRIERDNYDTVIAFSEGLPTHFLSNVNAKNKIAWIHCDYKSYLSFCTDKQDIEINAYSYFDKIVCVSEFTKKSFEDATSNRFGNVFSIPNVLDTSMMRFMAEEFTPDFTGRFNIVTVGRIDPVKRPSVIPMILSEILKRKTDVHWYIIGPTIWQSEYELLMVEINKYGVENNIHLLGQRNNPYPYIKNADLLVNTSVSEACPYVINEAKVLGTPVVCTDFGSAPQFITNGENGYYVPIEKMGAVISDLIADKDKYYCIKDNLKHFEYDNEAIKNQFLSLL